MAEIEVDGIKENDVISFIKENYPLIYSFGYKVGWMNLKILTACANGENCELEPDEEAFLNTLPLQIASALIGDLGQDFGEKVANAVMANHGAELITSQTSE